MKKWNRSISFTASLALTASIFLNGVPAAAANMKLSTQSVDSVQSLKDWKLAWSDEFNGKNGSSVDAGKWSFDIGKGPNGDGWGNQEQEIYTDSTENVFQKDGQLVIAAKKDSSGKLTSGRIKTIGKMDMKYGRVDVRAKLPSGTGFWPAIWMMPTDSVYGTWAASGEIDIMENKGRLPSEVYGTLHYGGAWPKNRYTGGTYKFPAGIDVTSYHTYSVEWEPGEIRWYVDGNLYQTQTNWDTKDANGEKYAFPAPFDQKFYVILNLAYGGNFDGQQGDGNNIPGQMLVDYVRAYKLTGRAYQTPKDPSITAGALPAGAKQPDSTGNLLSNGDFSSPVMDNGDAAKPFGTDWNFVHCTDAGTGTISIDSVDGKRFAKVDISNSGVNNYSIQLIQQTSIGKGRWYELSFDAKAQSDRSIFNKIGGGADRGYAAYADFEEFSLKTELKNYKRTFQMGADTDLNARVEFELGLSKNSVWIGNVKLKEVPAPVVDNSASREPLADGNLIYNGTFDKGDMNRLTDWNLQTAKGVASMEVSESQRELAVSIKKKGTSVGDVILSQKGLPLVKGAAYTLGFTARCSKEASMTAGVYGKDGKTVYMKDTAVKLTKKNKEYKLSFTMKSVDDAAAQLVLKLGADNKIVYFDHVSLKKTADGTTKQQAAKTQENPNSANGNVVVNGDFSKDKLDPWGSWSDGGLQTVKDGNSALLHISGFGVNPWSVQLYQADLKLEPNAKYRLTFKAKASVGRSFELDVEGAGYFRYADYTDKLTTDLKSYSYEVTVTKDEPTKLIFFFGKTDSSIDSTAKYDIHVQDVVLQKIE